MNLISSRIRNALWFLFKKNSLIPSNVSEITYPALFRCVRCDAVVEIHLNHLDKIEKEFYGNNGYLLNHACPRCELYYLLKIHSRIPINRRICSYCGVELWNATLTQCSNCNGPIYHEPSPSHPQRISIAYSRNNQWIRCNNRYEDS